MSRRFPGSRYHKALDQRRWQAVRLAVLDRDGWRCVRCGVAGGLEVDHIRPLHRGGDPWALENLQSLCRHCHIEKSRNERRQRTPAEQAWDALLQENIR